MSKIVDLRSDTVTLPTDRMREAMARAEVGDDVFGEDPTVRRLEELGAELMGKEAGLFLVSGTMANLVALLSHCGRGAEVIVGDRAHILNSEVGGASALGGIHMGAVPNDRLGAVSLQAVREAMRPQNIHYPPTGLVTIENSHNRCGGAVLDVASTEALCDLAHEFGVPVHLDGARIFNAAVALGVPAVALARPADSVCFCVSKGLSAPVGSVLTGGRSFIERARKNRKMVGGGMRQAGVIAAAGIVALETMVDRLADDHRNARRLAEGLAQLPGIDIDLEPVRTNIVHFQMAEGAMDPQRFAAGLQAEGVLCLPRDRRGVRMVTHYGIEDADIERALEAARRVMAG